MPYHQLPHLTADVYGSLNRAEAKDIPKARREIEKIRNSQPTQLHPEERTAFLEALLEDLRPGGVWSYWSEEFHTEALVAVKILGRNPVGSGEVLLKPETLATLVYHTCLAFPGRGRGIALATSAPALEALRVIANTLVLHPIARKKLSRMGGAEAVARALADELQTDRLFLLCRIGFLLTADGTSVKELVESEHIVPRLVYHLHTNRPIPSHYDALSELLKFTGNIIREYPKQASDASEEWDAALSPLLYPILCVVHSVTFNDLVQPLTHALHALLSIPFSSELLSTWGAVPAPQTDDRKKPSKSLFRRRGSPKEPVSPVHSRRGSSVDGLAPPIVSPSPSPTPSEDGVRPYLTPRANDPTVLPRRLITILETFVEAHLPGSSDLPAELALDEILAPVLLLAAHAAAGHPDMRSELHYGLLPPDLDRSPQAGPLETRPGLLGTLLRFMNGHVHLHCRDAAGELIWAACGSDEGVVCDEIGYGNAAGLLFRKNITGPPPARIREVSPPTPPSSSVPAQKRKDSSSSFASSLGTKVVPRPPPSGSLPKLPPTSPLHGNSRGTPTSERHPITALKSSHGDKGGPSAFGDMTDEEKEREAEKLFALFDRLERNPVLKAGAPKADGGGTQSLRDAMSDKVAEGVLDQWERKDAEKERLDAEREADEIEAEAMRELAEYKRRMGRH